MTREEFKKITGREVEDIAQFAGDPGFLLTLCGVIRNDGILDGVGQLADAYNQMLTGGSHEGSNTETLARVP